MSEFIEVDVAIVGAGPVGAHLASLVAKAGIKTALVDQNPVGEAGAQWVNGVNEWMLHEAGLSRPPDAEIHSEGSPFLVIPPSKTARVYLPKNPGYDVDMRPFGKRLQEAAVENGASVFFGTSVVGMEHDAHQIPHTMVCLDKTSQRDIRFKAQLFVDASGLSAVLREQHPVLKKKCPKIGREDLCTAAQAVYEIRDKHGAASFLESNRASPGDCLAFTGFFGGYSLLRVHIAPDLSHLAFLTGVMAWPDFPSAASLIQDFCKKNAWVGSRLYGGSRAIPLCRPYAYLISDRMALLGDAACQVYAEHGSGIGIGLIAAKILADTIIKAAKLGYDLGAPASLWSYPRTFHQKWGGLLAYSESVRRLANKFTPDDLHAFVSSGLLSPQSVHDSLTQTFPKMRISLVPKQFLGLLKNPRLARKVSRAVIRVPSIIVAAKRYPDDWDNLLWLEAYNKRLNQLMV